MSYGSYRAALARRQSRVERGSRYRERIRNRWRAVLAAALLVLALSTGFIAGTQSTAVVEMFAYVTGSAEALSASTARHFDNQTGELIPGKGTVPCYTREQRKTVVDTNSKFSWGR
jgi:hypothetical protein